MSNNKSEKLESKHNTKVAKLVNKQEKLAKKMANINKYEKNKSYVNQKLKPLKSKEREQKVKESEEMKNLLKSLGSSEQLVEDPTITIPEKLKSDQQLNKIVANPNFVSIFKSLKQKGYHLSIQITSEGTRSQSYGLSIKGKNTDITSDGSWLTNKIEDFINVISKLPASDLRDIKINIDAINYQLSGEKRKELSDLDQEYLNQKNEILKVIDKPGFWDSQEYLRKRNDLAKLLNKKDQNDDFIINNQELRNIKETIIGFVGVDNLVDVDLLKIGSNDGKIIIEGKYFKNRSISNAVVKEVKDIKTYGTRLDINKIGIIINSKLVISNSDEKGHELSSALEGVFGQGNYTILTSRDISNGGFKNFSLNLQPVLNLYLDGQKFNGTEPLRLQDDTKSITINGNTVTITNFDGSENILEVRKPSNN